MFNQITWTDYASTVVAFTVLYYIVTVTHYYRYEIAYYFSAKGKEKISFTTTQTEEKVEEA